ncbi:hypothetical protein ACVIW2_004941 [Bradyrhizobium huanghuaihaiense]|uniref:Uncharacterized protein n=1 Tax=Bradyrhizobium huanghuaihaiense TaxID=990078 RepID=A0A562QVR6_9BRAD|nr:MULTISPECIES: hypothetical protein [Bradyrhizobium]TWI60226.1 hypothetical protein IQ16_07724 [Bradyrhizobium huanghuaihaiense]UWU76355.1 hypothetical protein N2603_41875 [Bradyrhizobium sp. CB3035]WFU24280.1 hypothetical protein QA649_40860 [Bradyrhizobium sp. CB1717]
MPINPLISANINLTPEQRHVLELAFNRTLRKLNLVDRNDPICEIVARKVIEIEATGVTNAVAISEIAFRQLYPS